MIFSPATMRRQLVMLALAANVNGEMVNDARAIARNKTEALARMTVIDWNSPPSYTYTRIESSCDAYHLPFQCHQSAFTTSEKLTPNLIPMGKRPFTIQYDVVRQPDFLNINSDGAEMIMVETDWESKSDHFWIASASVTGLGTITVARRSQDEARPSIKAKIRSFGLKATCPGGHECHFETWIFHSAFEGPCRREAKIDKCVGSKPPMYLDNVCFYVNQHPDRYRDGFESEYDYSPDLAGLGQNVELPAHLKRPWPSQLRCSQYYKWAWKTCRDPQGPRFKDDAYCRFRIPVMRDGEPLSTSVFIKQNRRSKRELESTGGDVTVDVIWGFMGVDEKGNMIIRGADQR
ncbi:hypothetical protein L249_3713 [Ophiocordyceps polyrhachis-furcata BCC 54312]|uniref:Uncharacterized protein n=1 Tax=Ophiocordyceps polyrhachis-furcata BCC 54312 TaxID=1330021 RepID=A0A367L4V0_9HYPO|nr:hypothetical protein L249_3713 [Ophiocordyceps polyrhachis-furcata BCC 54312]